MTMIMMGCIAASRELFIGTTMLMKLLHGMQACMSTEFPTRLERLHSAATAPSGVVMLPWFTALHQICLQVRALMIARYYEKTLN